MSQFRAKEDCYLGPEHGGFREKDEVFEYDGPTHDSLVRTKAPTGKVDTGREGTPKDNSLMDSPKQ